MSDEIEGMISRDQINARALATDHLMAGLGARSANGVVVTILVQFTVFALQILNTAWMARVLAPEDFGVVALALSVTGFVGLFAELGLSVATVQRRELDQNTASVLFVVNLLAGFAGMVLCFGLAAPAAWVFSDTRVFWAVVGLGCALPLSAAAVQHNALLVRGMRWWPIQLIGLASLGAGVFVGIVAASLLNAGYWALVGASAATAITRLTLLWFVCPWRPSRVREWASARTAVSFGAHMTGFNLTLFLARQLDVTLIGLFWGTAQTGYYTRAYQLMLLPLNAISGPLGAVFVPALSRLQGDPARWSAAFMRAYLIAAIIGCAFASIFIVTADHLVNLVYGPGWEDTTEIFQWLSWSMYCTFPMGAMAWAFVSLGNSKAMLKWGLISFVVLGITFVTAVPYGVLGVAKAYTIAIWSLTPVCFHLALRKSPVSTSKALIEIAPIWIASFVAAAAGLQTKNFTGFGLLPDLVLESAVTASAFALVGFVLVYRRYEYQQMAVSSWALLIAAISNRSQSKAE